MNFRENLSKKLLIDRLAAGVSASLARSGEGCRIDKKAAASLLENAPYTYRRERDLDLYISGSLESPDKILVLDNELAFYRTTVDDVAMRKSPTLKEMVRIRNAVKILSDSDVVMTKRQDSLEIIRKECLDLLDLSFERSDLDAMENDLLAALETGNTALVIECLDLFAEILGYVRAPAPFRMESFHMVGALTGDPAEGDLFGPAAIYAEEKNFLVFVPGEIPARDKDALERLHDQARGKEKPLVEGARVAARLKEAVIRMKKRDRYSLKD